MMKKILMGAMLVMLVLFSCFFVTASFDEWFKGITGRATSQKTNATVSLAGTSSVTILIWNSTLTGATVTPTEDNVKEITFTVTVSDADGAADINDSSVGINVTKTGETTKVNSTCPFTAGTGTTTSRNYTCSFSMWYFDAAGAWTITAKANDYGNGTYIQNTSTFSWGSLAAMVMSPSALTWPGISPGQTNQTSNNDPTLLNNTGNFPGENVTITGINLVGLTDAAQFIGVGNITVDIATGGTCSGGACVECGVSMATGGTIMQNATQKEIYKANLTRGNHSVNDGSTGQEQLYYCMYVVPSNILSQSYSTQNAGEWTVTLIG
jgi:hypothetical protein